MSNKITTPLRREMMHKQEKQALLPKLRFPEFREAGEWDADELGKVAVFVNEKIPVAQVALENYVSTENILQDFGGVARASKLPTTGAVTRFRPHDTLVSNIRPYLKKVWVADKEGGASNDVIVIRAKQRLLPQYFSFLLKNDAFIDYVMTGAKGVKMPRGDIGSMKAYPALYPTKPEQQNIADCLASLDELITLETQKLDTLKTHKKGLMQQLLPAEGETLPKLRFPEFRDAGEWKKKQIGKALIEQPRPIDMDEEGEYSLVTVKRRYGGVVSRGVFMGKSIKVKTQFLLQENDFLISKRQIVHCACGVVPKTLDGSIVSNEYSVLRARDGFDVLFFDYFAQQPTVSQSFLRCSIGIVIEKMLFKLNDWLKEEFFFPSLQEQKKIADCLTTLDDLITAQTQKLAAIKIHKKGLMQQLFPSPEEV
jgi:type I restriction enzyme S subunit